jgi:hypothetical protein
MRGRFSKFLIPDRYAFTQSRLSALPPGFHYRTDKLSKRPVFLALFNIRQFVKVRFLLEFPVILIMLRIEIILLYGLPDGATRFVGVTAIGETTVLRKRLNISEAIVYSFADAHHPEFPHTRHIDQQATVLKHDELAARVVCLPSPEPLTSLVSNPEPPTRRLISVVLPTPDEPSRQYVFPGTMISRI